MSVDFFHTHVSDASVELATDTLRSGWLSEGKRVAELERAFEERLGMKNVVALNSGTSSLHLALAVAGVGRGDEVIIPAQTFVATGLAVLMLDAVPVFADIDPHTGNLSVAAVRAAMSDRTRAILPVHWAGYPCDLDELNELASEHDAVVVEDAAHAMGASYKGQPVGTVSPFTCFSLQAIKHLTSGDGGLLCCKEADAYQAARRRRWFGIDRAASKPSVLGEREFDITEVGYKYHLNDLGAAVAMGNLSDFQARLERRQANGQFLRESLADVDGISLLEVSDDRTHAYWLFTLRVQRREAFIRALKSRGVPASVVHLRIDRYSVFGGLRELPQQALFDQEQVSLPVHDALSENDLGRIVEAVKEGW